MTAKEYLENWIKENPDKCLEYKEGWTVLDYLNNELHIYIEEVSAPTNLKYYLTFNVIQAGDKFTGFTWAKSYDSNYIHDLGFEFDENTLCFVEPYEIKTIKYKKVNGQDN